MQKPSVARSRVTFLGFPVLGFPVLGFPVLGFPVLVAVTLAFLIPFRVVADDDLVEFLNGIQLSGKVTKIDTGAKQFDFESTVGESTVHKSYSFAEVHAVTLKGKRHLLTERAEPPTDATSASKMRSETEVRQLIQAAGAADPSWWAATPVDYPGSLDLSWPLKPPEGWNNQKNVGQFIWDVINPNPNRWAGGVKLVQQVMQTHDGKPALLDRDYKTLGRMYFELLQDYARAAYWFQKAGVNGRMGEGVKLAECYFRLGNREMAVEVLTQPILPFSAIKLLAELGELETALRLANAYEGNPQEAQAQILAADALRIAGRNDEAIAMYERVVHSDSFRNDEYEARFVGRARDSIEAIRLADKADVKKVANGTYRESSIGYNGMVEVEVVVADGKIADLKVTKHREKQFYSALEDTPGQILKKQSVRDIDGFSGATITSAAIVNATAKALAQGTP